jgi:hypothetical protein
MKKIVLAVLVFTMAESSFATIINVPGDYDTIQQGIDASIDGDTVLVQPGTYYENINFNMHNTMVAGNYIITGDSADISNTIINGSQPQNSDTASCVRIVSGEDSSAVLVGFTLTGGQGTVWRDIHNNLWYREGGGIIIELSSPTIRNNYIINNEAVNDSAIQSAGGGGIRAGDGNPVIEGNVIANNTGLYGGGIVLNYATGTIRNNVIYSNSGGQDYGGGGIWSYGGGISLIENNTIVSNSSDLDGGGLLVWSTSVIARNNIIYMNSDIQGYPQIRLRPGSSANVSYSDIEGGWAGVGNVDLDPLFKNAAGGDFHLMSIACGDTLDSPCIDAGSPNYADSLLDCSWGLGGPRSDMGAFGGGDTAFVGVFDQPSSLPNEYMIRNYPNPFNQVTLIEFDLMHDCFVTIDIIDIMGRKTADLVNEYRPVGRNFAAWDASGCASGIYFCRLQACEFKEIRRMVLVK